MPFSLCLTLNVLWPSSLKFLYKWLHRSFRLQSGNSKTNIFLNFFYHSYKNGSRRVTWKEILKKKKHFPFVYHVELKARKRCPLPIPLPPVVGKVAYLPVYQLLHSGKMTLNLTWAAKQNWRCLLRFE